MAADAVSPTAPVKVEAPRMASPSTISPKAILAAALPAFATLAAVLVQWAISGEFNKPELTTAIVGVVSSVLSGLGAYLGAPGAIQFPVAAQVEYEGHAAQIHRMPSGP